MLNLFRFRWVMLTLAMVGTGSPLWAQAPEMYKPDQHIMVKIGNQGQRRCVVVVAKPQADGTVEYQLKAIDNGETLTVYDRPGTATARQLPPTDADTPKPISVNSDPLLASSLRRPVGPFERPESARLAATPVRETSRQPILPAGVEPTQSGLKRMTIVMREPRTKSELHAQQTELPPSTIGNAIATYDPVPLNMGRPNSLPRTSVSHAPTVNDPVPLGFVIPVSNSQTTPRAKNFEREERIVRLGDTLRNELKPSAREFAAEALAEGVGADSAAVRSLLLTAAVNDPAATVRATCVRCLVKIGVKDQAMAALIVTGKQDPDARVRIEIDRAEELLK